MPRLAASQQAAFGPLPDPPSPLRQRQLHAENGHWSEIGGQPLATLTGPVYGVGWGRTYEREFHMRRRFYTRALKYSANPFFLKKAFVFHIVVENMPDPPFA